MTEEQAKRLTDFICRNPDELLLFTDTSIIINKNMVLDRITNFFNRDENGALCAASEGDAADVATS